MAMALSLELKCIPHNEVQVKEAFYGNMGNGHGGGGGANLLSGVSEFNAGQIAETDGIGAGNSIAWGIVRSGQINATQGPIFPGTTPPPPPNSTPNAPTNNVPEGHVKIGDIKDLGPIEPPAETPAPSPSTTTGPEMTETSASGPQYTSTYTNIYLETMTSYGPAMNTWSKIGDGIAIGATIEFGGLTAIGGASGGATLAATGSAITDGGFTADEIAALQALDNVGGIEGGMQRLNVIASALLRQGYTPEEVVEMLRPLYGGGTGITTGY